MEQSTFSLVDVTVMTQDTGPRQRLCRPRRKAPVFVLGCPRSGTTLLYHMLLSAGGFAVYRAESNVFNLLSPRFGGLRSRSSREKCLHAWLQSKLFRVAGLETEEISCEILNECRNPGDCLCALMGAVARKQGVQRWADCTPDHLLYIRQIKREIPDALIIHIIRDGRDVALSYARQGWSHPLPWYRDQPLAAAALYWSWIVAEGRKHGRELGADYLEVRYENLVVDPRGLLNRVSEFLDQDLDYHRIQRVGIGSVSAPNTSFASDSKEGFNPVGRWKRKMTPAQLSTLESLIGDRLRELGYSLSQASSRRGMRVRYMRTLYRNLFAAKLWLKSHTPLGRFADVGPMELSQ